jgi:SAM-dependent methyltransferase
MSVEAVEEQSVDPVAVVKYADEIRKVGSAESLLFNYVLNNGAPKDRNVATLLKILRASVDLGHHEWPASLKRVAAGKDVLHYRCGQTLYGPAFKALGATSYTGIDSAIVPASKKFRSRKLRAKVGYDFSLVDVARLIPDITYMQSDVVVFEQAFDLVVLQSITHSLADLRTMFQQLHRALRPGGEIWFSHENYYAWGGHQGEPKHPRVLDANNPEHQLLADWGHVRSELPEGHRIRTALNRLRPIELRRITDTYFEVSQWKEERDKGSIAARLTPNIRDQLSGYTDAELLTKQIVCRAARREFV